MSVTRHLPQANNVVELTRTFNRVWDAINIGESERRQAVDQIRSSVSGLNDKVNNIFTAIYVTRYEPESDGVKLVSDDLGHTRLVPYSLKVLA